MLPFVAAVVLATAPVANAVGPPRVSESARDLHTELVLAQASGSGNSLASWVEDRHAVAVVELAGDYNRDLPDGSSNLEPRTLVAQEFFAHNSDESDFLVVFSTFPFDAGPAKAFAWVVRNDVEGIGLPQFDNGDQFGSARLQSYVDMTDLSSFATDPLDPAFETTLVALAHELQHRWGARVRVRRPDGTLSNELLGQDGSHWSFLLDSDASLHYGNDWRDNGDGTFTSTATLKFYSPLDLYLGGFYRSDEVPPMTLIEAPGVDPTRLPERGATVSGTVRTVMIADVVAAEGPRVPAADAAQHDFRAAFVLLKRPGEPVTDEQIAGIDRVRRELAARFSVLTGGRGLMDVFPQAVVGTRGEPGGVAGGPPRLGGRQCVRRTRLAARPAGRGGLLGGPPLHPSARHRRGGRRPRPPWTRSSPAPPRRRPGSPPSLDRRWTPWHGPPRSWRGSTTTWAR